MDTPAEIAIAPPAAVLLFCAVILTPPALPFSLAPAFIAILPPAPVPLLVPAEIEISPA